MTTRILPVEEWYRLKGTELEQASQLLPYDATVMVVEDGGRIIACLTAVPMTHVEGIWVDPNRRGDGVGMRLWDAMQQNLAKHDIRSVVAGSVTTEMDRTLTSLGATPLPGTLFVLPVRG